MRILLSFTYTHIGPNLTDRKKKEMQTGFELNTGLLLFTKTITNIFVDWNKA